MVKLKQGNQGVHAYLPSPIAVPGPRQPVYEGAVRKSVRPTSKAKGEGNHTTRHAKREMHVKGRSRCA